MVTIDGAAREALHNVRLQFQELAEITASQVLVSKYSLQSFLDRTGRASTLIAYSGAHPPGKETRSADAAEDQAVRTLQELRWWGDARFAAAEYQNDVIKAIEVVREISGQEKTHVFGFCVGGTIAATALAV